MADAIHDLREAQGKVEKALPRAKPGSGVEAVALQLARVLNHLGEAVADVTPEMWAVSAPVREMPDGTLVLGIYAESGEGAYGGVVRSTDHGKTWSEPISIW